MVSKYCNLTKLLLAVSLIFVGLPVKAEQDLLIGGSQYSRASSYSYLGLIKPVADGELGKGWFVSAIGSWLTYEYDINVNNQADTLKAKAPGIDFGLGYGWQGDKYYLQLSAAAGYRDYRLSPNVPGEEPEGSMLSLTPQFQVGYQFTPTVDIGLLSNWSIGPQSQFNRLRLGFRPSGVWHIGLEGIYQDGKNYRSKQYGLFATRYLAKGLSLELHGGTLQSQDISSAAYLGAAFSKTF